MGKEIRRCRVFDKVENKCTDEIEYEYDFSSFAIDEDGELILIDYSMWKHTLVDIDQKRFRVEISE